MSLNHVDVKTARTLQSDEGHIYVDVRSIPEFEKGHPEGARNVPLLNVDPLTGQMQPNREFLSVMRANYPPATKLLIGCQMGGRSAQAGQVLVAFGISGCRERTWRVRWNARPRDGSGRSRGLG